MKKITLLSIFFLCTVWIACGQWTYTNLSEPKAYMGAIVLGSKAYFAGGMNSSGLKSTVEIYEAVTGEWDTTQHLSVARDSPSVVTCGSLVFFGGGVDFFSSGATYSTVDIFNTQTQQWSVGQFSVPRFGAAAFSDGNKVFFVGGLDLQLGIIYDNVDIYDVQTQQWSTTSLPEPRYAWSTVTDDFAILAGGYNATTVTKRVDIYNFTTGIWTIDSLSVARGFLGITAVGDKVVVAGGTTGDNLPSNVVDIYDISDGSWTTATLSLARAFCDNQNAVTVDGKAYFLGGGIFVNGYWDEAYSVIDIYDPATNTWSVDSIPGTTSYVHRAAVSFGSQFLVAGGIWDDCTSKVAIYNCSTTVEEIKTGYGITIVPNPSNDKITISLPSSNSNTLLSIFTVGGEKVIESQLTNTETQLDLNTLPRGVYFVMVQNEKMVDVGKIVKQ